MLGVVDPVVGVAIVVLAFVFLLSLFVLLLLIRQKYCTQLKSDERPILKYSRDKLCEPSSTLQDVLYDSDNEINQILRLSPTIEKLLASNDWAYDSSELVKRCLLILTNCHHICIICEQTVKTNSTSQEMLDLVRESTGCVMPRVDDLLRTMKTYSSGSIPSTLLEARSAALVMALTNLVTCCRAAFPHIRKEECSILRKKVQGLFQDLDILRQASIDEELRMAETVHMQIKHNHNTTVAADNERTDNDDNSVIA